MTVSFGGWSTENVIDYKEKFDVVYDDDGQLILESKDAFSHTDDDIPDFEGTTGEKTGLTEYIEAEGAGYELELKLSLLIDASETVKNESCILTDLSLSPAKEPAEPGIIVYYAGGEETFWDIAKAFRADAAQFMKEDYFAHVPAGKKLMIIRR